MEEEIKLTYRQKERLSKLIGKKERKFWTYVLCTMPATFVSGFYFFCDAGYIPLFVNDTIKYISFIITVIISAIVERIVLNSNIFEKYGKNLVLLDKNVKCTLIGRKNIEIKKEGFWKKTKIVYKLRGRERNATNILGKTIHKMKKENLLAVIECKNYKWEVALSILDICLYKQYNENEIWRKKV